MLLVNAEEEKILSDKDLEIKNDEPVLEDQELLDDLLAEAENGKSLNVQYKYLVVVWFSVLVFCLKVFFFFLLLIWLHKRNWKKVLYYINRLIRSF